MKSKYRVVLDANVLFSALLFKDCIPRKAFNKAIDTGELLISFPVLYELNTVLSRAKLNKYLLESEKREFMALLFKEAELNEPQEDIRVCRDSKDDKYLELAVCGNADFIISGVNDLLVLNPFRDIRILTPGQYMKLELP
jgi:putative PIN family toxin of toxin-antitoxin system